MVERMMSQRNNSPIIIRSNSINDSPNRSGVKLNNSKQTWIPK